MKSEAGIPFFLVVGIILFGILGVISVGSWLKERHWLSEARDWPRARGTIVESRVDYDCVSIPAAACPEIRRATIRYRYVVSEYPYEEEIETHTVGPWFFLNRPNRIVAQYPAGASVAVYYNPADPSESVPEPFSSWDWRRLIVGLMLLGMALLLPISRIIRTNQ